MSLIQRGQGLRKLATSGFRRASEIEAQDVRQQQAIEAAKEAQEGQTYGAGASIGAMYGIRNLPSSSGGTTTLINQPISYEPTNMIQGAENQLRQVIPSPGASGSNYSPVEAVNTIAAETSLGASPVVPVTPEVGAALTEGATVAGSGGAGGAAASSSSAGASGLMSNIGTIAAPIAIGLGVAFLINKLFD